MWKYASKGLGSRNGGPAKIEALRCAVTGWVCPIDKMDRITVVEVADLTTMVVGKARRVVWVKKSIAETSQVDDVLVIDGKPYTPVS